MGIGADAPFEAIEGTRAGSAETTGDPGAEDGWLVEDEGVTAVTESFRGPEADPEDVGLLCCGERDAVAAAAGAVCPPVTDESEAGAAGFAGAAGLLPGNASLNPSLSFLNMASGARADCEDVGVTVCQQWVERAMRVLD
jgi:hypothetical protein